MTMCDLNCKEIIGESLDYEPWVTLSLFFNRIIYTEDSVSESRMLYSINLDTVTRNFDICMYTCHILQRHTPFKNILF